MNPFLIAMINLAVGLIAGAVGGFVGVKVGLARVETWRDIRDGDIKSLMRDCNVHGDDILVHDCEIGSLMHAAGMHRMQRQRIRD